MCTACLVEAIVAGLREDDVDDTQHGDCQRDKHFVLSFQRRCKLINQYQAADDDHPSQTGHADQDGRNHKPSSAAHATDAVPYAHHQSTAQQVEWQRAVECA